MCFLMDQVLMFSLHCKGLRIVRTCVLESSNFFFFFFRFVLVGLDPFGVLDLDVCIEMNWCRSV